MDALLFVTPEYNRSVPGVLKNAIDVGSRPKVDNVWNGKPAVIYKSISWSFKWIWCKSSSTSIISMY